MDVVRHHDPGNDLEWMRLSYPPNDLAQIADAIHQETTRPLSKVRREEIGCSHNPGAKLTHAGKVP